MTTTPSTTPSPEPGRPPTRTQIDARQAQGVQAGDHNTQVNHFAGRAPVTWPALVGVMPALADQRVDRPADGELADAVTNSEQTVVLCQVLAGLGGVGKTQLAAALAHRLRGDRDVDLLVWITATSRSAILAGYTEAARRVTGIDDTNPEQAAARFLAWLNETHQRRWLIVLDNLDDPNDLIGLWPPTVIGGHTVVTTRRRDTALLTGRRLIDVDVFTPDQAAAYLHQKLSGQPQSLDEAEELAADLGHLPLALSQAAAYILDRVPRMTCAHYRTLLADQRRSLSHFAPHALPDQNRDIVAATWTLSIQRADELPPAGLARPVLQLAALLDPNGIPLDVLTATRVAAYCAQRLDRPVDRDDLDDALHTLRRFSLLTVDETTGTARAHALLQRAVRDNTDPDDQPPLATAAAAALFEQWPRVERNASHAQAHRANTTALWAVASTYLCNAGRGVHPVLFRVNNSLGDIGLFSLAAAAYRQLLDDCLRILGPDHRDTLAARGNLAQCRGMAGDPAGAADAFQQLLDDCLRILGPDHPDTLAARGNLAWSRSKAGDPAGAADAFQQLLDDCLRILGPDHRDTLIIRSNIGESRGEAGDPAGAADAFQQLLDDCLRILGPDHKQTLAARTKLATWRGKAGDPAGAADAFQQLLDSYLRILGPDHPDTLTARGNLARWRGKAGDPAGAADAFQQLLDSYLRILGPDHPDTLAAGSNVGEWRGEAGDPAGAADAFQQLLDSYLRILGPDHPQTLAARGNLARWRGEAGDPAGAVNAFQQLLDDCLRMLGPDHPHTLMCRKNLTYWGAWAEKGDHI
ncbi:tetratricopeptide repeat protein [Paractinoplanes rhizophilus]|uniref:Tetratricopeptide repeat protein n=1 Tax=Paractinoplanes rhizophilus TaxID=1416877 RepID=A0ABW2I569_9ACTN